MTATRIQTINDYKQLSGLHPSPSCVAAAAARSAEARGCSVLTPRSTEGLQVHVPEIRKRAVSFGSLNLPSHTAGWRDPPVLPKLSECASATMLACSGVCRCNPKLTQPCCLHFCRIAPPARPPTSLLIAACRGFAPFVCGMVRRAQIAASELTPTRHRGRFTAHPHCAGAEQTPSVFVDLDGTLLDREMGHSIVKFVRSLPNMTQRNFKIILIPFVTVIAMIAWFALTPCPPGRLSPAAASSATSSPSRFLPGLPWPVSPLPTRRWWRGR